MEFLTTFVCVLVVLDNDYYEERANERRERMEEELSKEVTLKPQLISRAMSEAMLRNHSNNSSGIAPQR